MQKKKIQITQMHVFFKVMNLGLVFNPLLHNVEMCKHRKILKYVWPFFNIMK